MGAEKQVISAKDWKVLGGQTFTLTLPSGAIVELKKLNLLESAATGHIPLNLLNESMKMSEKMTKAGGWEDMSEADLKGMLELIDKVTLMSVINPAVSKTKKENAILVSDIPTDDKLAIFGFVNTIREGSADLAPFRAK